MTLSDLKVIRGQTPPGGFFELFTPNLGGSTGMPPGGSPAERFDQFFFLYVADWTLRLVTRFKEN